MITNRRELTPNLLPVYLVPYAIEFERAGEGMWRATIDLRLYRVMTKGGLPLWISAPVVLLIVAMVGRPWSMRGPWVPEYLGCLIGTGVLAVGLLVAMVWVPRRAGETLTITVRATEIAVRRRKGSVDSVESIAIDQWTAGIRIVHLWRGGNKGRFHTMHAVYLRAPGHEIPLAVYEDAVDAKLYRERLPTPLGGHSHNYTDEGETRTCMWDTWENRVMTGQREGKVPGRRV